ncbi:DUF5819 family protein [Streptomyces sp. NPDC003027]
MEPAAQSRWARLLVEAAAVVVVGAVLVHLGMVFFHVAPENAVSKQYARTIHGYVGPELSQSWRVFAPDPGDRNTRILARARTGSAEGAARTTPWVDLTALDLAELRGSLLPSVTMDQIRQGWRDYSRHHDAAGRPIGDEGLLYERFLKRLALGPLSRHTGGAVPDHIQFRTVTTTVTPPRWAAKPVPTAPTSQVHPWLRVTREDITGEAGAR